MVPAPYVFNATVVRVHDGDTFEVVISYGDSLYRGSTEHPIPIRFLGMNARELAEPGGPEARDNLAALLPVGSKVVLHTTKPDKYGTRTDAVVETPTTADLGADLIAAQWGAVYFGVGPKNVPPWPRV